MTHLQRTLLMIVGFASAGCNADILSGGEVVTMEIDHKMDLCEGNGEWLCPRAREVGASAWQPLPCASNFRFQQWGVTYEALVEVSPHDDRGQLHDCDESHNLGLSHRVDEVLLETPVEAGTTFVVSTSRFVVQEQNDGSLALTYALPIQCRDTATCTAFADEWRNTDGWDLVLTFAHDNPGERPLLVAYTFQ